MSAAAGAASRQTAAAVQTVRRAVLWVPDWPVVAATADAGLPGSTPAAVLHGRGMVAVNAVARAAGVRRGMRKRLAQRRCPEIELLPHDEGRDARAFEAVAAAAEQVVSGVEVSRPGMLMIPSLGAARFHGGEGELAEALVTAVAEQADAEAGVGIADGLLAAVLAAREGDIVPPGGSAAYLADRPVSDLAHAAMEPRQRQAIDDLVSVLDRLGIRALGDYVDLPAADVLARFGAPGMWARTLAAGLDLRPPVLRRIEQDIEVEVDLEDAATTVEQLAFVARAAAESLDARLTAERVRCLKVAVAATTEAGERLERVWRTDVGARPGAFARQMADRVRWQLEGWLTGIDGGPERANIASMTLAARDVIAAGQEQEYLWGGTSGADSRAHRTMERLQGLMGVEAVLIAHEQGGRGPADRVALVPWGQEPGATRRADLPWPGRVPDPAPATVLVTPERVRLFDAGGRDVRVTERLAVSAPPTWLQRDRDEPAAVAAWAGPWPVAERWWAEDGSRRAYLQVALADGPALLVASSRGEWTLEAVYD